MEELLCVLINDILQNDENKSLTYKVNKTQILLKEECVFFFFFDNSYWPSGTNAVSSHDSHVSTFV